MVPDQLFGSAEARSAAVTTVGRSISVTSRGLAQKRASFVGNPTEGAAFYGRLLGIAPVEASPTFVKFSLKDRIMAGLWIRDEVAPAVQALPELQSSRSLSKAEPWWI